MRQRIVTLIAAPLGSMLPGQPVDWEQLPPNALAWAEKQANNDNEMLTIMEGDHSAELQADYNIYIVNID